MKVKDLAKFLERCDPEADLYVQYVDTAKVGIVLQGYASKTYFAVNTNQTEEHTEYGVYISAVNDETSGEVEAHELVAVDTDLMPNVKIK